MDYLKTNKKLWDTKTNYHLKSDFYEMEAFLNGKSSLKSIELGLLENIRQKSILHLQCHFGQDTLSLARLGANVTGIDLSDNAIQAAQELSVKTRLKAKFIQTDVYSVPKVLKEKFDTVFTSYGTIGWLPDLNRWAEVIKRMLNPGGQFIFVEFHPVVWMFSNEFDKIEFSYFNKETIIEELEGTYADRSAPIKNKSICWNHSLGDVFNSLHKHGFHIQFFEEYDYSPYDCFPNTVKLDDGKFQIKGMEGKIPMVYALKASLNI